MKVSTTILSLLSSIALVAAIPVSHPTRTSKESVLTLTGTRLSPITTTFTEGTMVRRTVYEPTHTSEKDCPYVCNGACWAEGGCTDEAYSSWLSAVAADYKSSWDSRLLEHWSSTHTEPRPTTDAEGMSVSWRTIEASPTAAASTVVKRSDGIRDPHWSSGPTNIAELDCDNVCNLACFVDGGCTPELYQKWQDEIAQSRRWHVYQLENRPAYFYCYGLDSSWCKTGEKVGRGQRRRKNDRESQLVVSDAVG
ncbi:uncharacterized protein M437DRAFT_85092 [Aureobasidium melanogenum CBS 110374]|uniref:Apple domain-containing protein n=1 Tax=Aureobasidium melanogenum (strain CBS 110374) TaxID=1043003 RepID=A0A074VNB5_AURM1|nr:uncharacterized protein M437DRAFT_85092 [Aureobasidium melanogenum CBS 110374]KEQ62190.1 hypothetical protein M437DRAFT_85092 [Aureobasidium melanogenum CBS 110374]